MTSECTYCRGAGTIDCPDCRGLGRLFSMGCMERAIEDACGSCHGVGFVRCRYCDGEIEVIGPRGDISSQVKWCKRPA